MATRVKPSLPLHFVSESLWSKAPPSFLAPCLRYSSPSFSTTAPAGISFRRLQRNRNRQQDNRDAYTLRQVKARRDANLSRQAVLKEQRKQELGDPIRGVTTPFVESFDSHISQEAQKNVDTSSISVEALKENPDQPPPSPAHASNEKHLDHGITQKELVTSLEISRKLTEPLPPDNEESFREKQDRVLWEARDRSAMEAVARIVSLANASSKSRTKKNVERIVETFGRHKTDEFLRPKGAAMSQRDPSNPAPVPTPRAGPDTGSSEVQIGVLTAKIRVLADRYEGENRNDKINKRNLRLLLHRRQKLLKYMEKKERGSERWQRMIEMLGLTPATWHGQIAVE